jgi:excisionase family DNA binding protein
MMCLTNVGADEEMAMDEKLLTVADICERLQVHEETVRRWLRDGRLKGINLGGKSGYRVRASELEEFLLKLEEEQGKAAA